MCSAVFVDPELAVEARRKCLSVIGGHGGPPSMGCGGVRTGASWAPYAKRRRFSCLQQLGFVIRSRCSGVPSIGPLASNLTTENKNAMKRIPSVARGRHLLVIAGLALASTVGSLLAADTYYVSDHLATTTAVADAVGEIASLETDAFGSPVSGGEQAARYTGKPYDADIGAYVFPFRNYRSDEARWMSADPSGFPDGSNARLYAPSPLHEVDSLGLFTLSNSFSPSSVTGSYGGNSYRVSSLSISEIAVGGSTLDLMRSEYSNITFTQVSGSINGTLTVNNMAPTLFGSDRGGLTVDINFDPNGLNGWFGNSGVGLIQVVTTSHPLPGRSSPTVDVGGMLQGINPFYNPNDMLNVIDGPNRYLNNAPVDWTAYVILARRIDASNIEIYDGIQYSFQIRPLE
jgi:RHS repeat-associated protein